MAARPKIAPHKHIWQRRPTRGPQWPYVCTVCGGKSRNTFCQDAAFREPVTFRATILVGPSAGKSFTWECEL